MSVILELIQYDELIAKLNSLLEKVADKETQQLIKLAIDELRNVVAKEGTLSSISQAVQSIDMTVKAIDSALDSIYNEMARSSKQDAMISILDTIRQIVDTIRSTLTTLQTVVAKEAKQDTIISRLDTISSKLDVIASLLGTPLPTYSVTALASAVAANKHHLTMFNTSTRRIRILNITTSAEVTTTVTGFQIGMRVYRITAVSGGTALTIAKFDTGDPDVTGLTVVNNPTSVTLGPLLFGYVVNPEETAGQHTYEIDLVRSGMKPIVLRTNEGITIQQYGTAGVGSVTVTVVFTVE